MKTTETLLAQFSAKHQLPDHYSAMAQQWFVPLAEELYEKANANIATPLLVGINGCQGSGKSTLSEFLKHLLAAKYPINVIVLSIDDFYLTRAERQTLAQRVHPLFTTRGVPGTHDIHRMQSCLLALLAFSEPVIIPRFNKASDDRHLPEQWETVDSRPDIIILEGWCVGARAQHAWQLGKAVNTLEKEEDSDSIWRGYSNQQLDEYNANIFDKLEYLIQLKAPSFDCVYQWRKQQEDKLRQRCSNDDNSIMNEQQLIRFVHHYQRITEHCLQTIPQFADCVFHLNADHQITHKDSKKNSDI